MALGQVAGAVVRAGLWVVAIAILALSVAAASDGERPAHISYFEPLAFLPAAAGTAQHKSGDCLQQLRFDAFGRRFEISLGSNTRLMASKPDNRSSSCIAARSTASPDPGCGLRRRARRCTE